MPLVAHAGGGLLRASGCRVREVQLQCLAFPDSARTRLLQRNSCTAQEIRFAQLRTTRHGLGLHALCQAGSVFKSIFIPHLYACAGDTTMWCARQAGPPL